MYSITLYINIRFIALRLSVKHCLSISELDDFLEALYTHGISAYLKSGYFPDETAQVAFKSNLMVLGSVLPKS
jgi:hypothetical protein